MKTLKNIFEVHALETGVFIVILCTILLIIEFITANKFNIKNKRFITCKSFFKDWLFLILMLFFGLSLIFKNMQ